MSVYRTQFGPREIATALEALGFSYVESSCSCTTYARGSDLLSIEEPDGEVYEDVEIATDFRLSPLELGALGAWHIGR